MKKVVAIVEGYGDCAAVPQLLYRLGHFFDEHIISQNPIRVGEWKKLSRAGEMERALELASSRGASHILIVLDLDDGCAVAEAMSGNARIETWKNGRQLNVSLVFLVREYESLFLATPEAFTNNQDVINETIVVAESERNAKGLLKRVTGRRYKETQDQIEYTRRLDIAKLLIRSRCARKLARVITGLTYEEIDRRLVA